MSLAQALPRPSTSTDALPALETDCGGGGFCGEIAANERPRASVDLLAYSGLVHRIARQLQQQSSRRITCAELVQIGMSGLFAAARTNDPSRSDRFAWLAASAIRDAMIGHLHARGLQTAPLSA